MILWNIYFLSFLFGSLIVLLLSLHPPLWKVKSYIQLIVVLILVSTLSQALFFYKYYMGKEVAVLFTLVAQNKQLFWIVSTGKGIVVSLDGGVYGFKTGIKMCIALLSGLFVILTTRPLELFRSFLHIGLPSSIALMAITALKFIPTIYEEFRSALRALKMKGHKLKVSNFYSLVKLSVSNAIYRSIRRAMILGLSLDLRGFSGGLKTLKEFQYSLKANIVIIVLTLFISLLFLLVFTNPPLCHLFLSFSISFLFYP